MHLNKPAKDRPTSEATTNAPKVTNSGEFTASVNPNTLELHPSPFKEKFGPLILGMESNSLSKSLTNTETLWIQSRVKETISVTWLMKPFNAKAQSEAGKMVTSPSDCRLLTTSTTWEI
jgi:hypothetical protein